MSVVTGSGGGTGGSTAYFSSFLATTNKAGTDTATVTGSVAGTVGATTLSTPTIASHSHTFPIGHRQPENAGPSSPSCLIFNVCCLGAPFVPGQPGGVPPGNRGSSETNDAGGGGSHTHPFSGSLSSASADVSVTVPAANVKYANVIIAAKD